MIEEEDEEEEEEEVEEEVEEEQLKFNYWRLIAQSTAQGHLRA